MEYIERKTFRCWSLSIYGKIYENYWWFKRRIYCYNFCLDSNRRVYQPSGAMNVNKFKKVFFEFNTVEVPLDISGSNIEYICDLNGNAIGFRKTSAILNEYNFDLRIFEERYNILYNSRRTCWVIKC